MGLDVGVAVGLKGPDRARVDAFEQNNLHFIFGKRGFGHDVGA